MNAWSTDSSRVSHEIQVRDSLVRSMDANGSTPSRFLELLDVATAENLWEKLPNQSGDPFPSFMKYITAPRPYGLGLNGKEDLRKHIALEHKEEREPYYRASTAERMMQMRKRVDSLLIEEIQPEQTNGGDRRSGEFQPDTIRLKTQDNSADYVVARLKRDADHDPRAADLLGRVSSGEIKPNSAAREMQWRSPRILVTTPERTAKAIKKFMTDPEARARLARLLMEEN